MTFGLLLRGRHIGLRGRIGGRETRVEQVVLQRAEVASQLLASLGDGGAEGRGSEGPPLLVVAVDDAD
jgi:hypothetical protein